MTEPQQQLQAAIIDALEEEGVEYAYIQGWIDAEKTTGALRQNAPRWLTTGELARWRQRRIANDDPATPPRRLDAGATLQWTTALRDNARHLIDPNATPDTIAKTLCGQIETAHRPIDLDRDPVCPTCAEIAGDILAQQETPS